MGIYRARDLFRVPGLLSLSRLPLAALFPLVVGEPALALAVLGAAAFSDVLDGWWARRFHQATSTGAMLDAVTDKLFVLTVAVTLIVRGFLPATAVLLLATREAGELPLVVWLATSRSARRGRAENPKANVPGKMATVLQFLTIVTALFHSEYTGGMTLATAVVGAFAAATYWVREVKETRARSR